MDNSQPVRIEIYANPHQAELDAALLRSHGLECRVTGNDISTTLSWYGLAVAKVELWTAAENADAAAQLLKERAETSSLKRNLQLGKDPDWVCPSCGEASGSSFDECWACGEVRPETPEQRPADTELTRVQLQESVESEVSVDPSPYRSPAIIRSRLRLTSGDELVRRATRSAILALSFPPLSVYSLHLIHQCFQQGTPPIRVYVALAIAALCLMITGIYAFSIVSQFWSP